MEFEVSYSLENEQQFWDELDEIVSGVCESHESIDNCLRSYLSFTTKYRTEYLQNEYDVAKCSYRLLDSKLFTSHKDYVRRQIIYGLLQEDASDVLYLIAAFLVFDGKQNESTFETMNTEGAFSRILELLSGVEAVDPALHRTLLILLYEMSRIQRIRDQDLMLIEEEFVTTLFGIIEGHSDDVSDPYHYPVIRVLLVLNEQYMVSAHDPGPGRRSAPLPNLVIRVLSAHGNSFKTFGENIILLLNRETETSLQLLILKLLYLLFTTSATYEYFYTNDLRVLVDVMIRNLLDLPISSNALRHTYLRVLYPLLAHTQLKQPENHYKRDELLKLLFIMSGGGSVETAHFGAIDDTTKRLGARCAQVAWLCAPKKEELLSPRHHNGLWGIGLNAKAAESSLSVVEVAAHKAKPGEQTPSRIRQLQDSKKKKNKSISKGNGTTGAGGDGGGGGSGGNGDHEHLDSKKGELPENERDIGVLSSPFEAE